MSFRLVGVHLLSRWYEAEPDAERQARMDEWLADLLDAPWARSHDVVPGPNALLRVAIVPGTGWAVELLINDGDRQVEAQGLPVALSRRGAAQPVVTTASHALLHGPLTQPRTGKRPRRVPRARPRQRTSVRISGPIDVVYASAPLVRVPTMTGGKVTGASTSPAVSTGRSGSSPSRVQAGETSALLGDSAGNRRREKPSRRIMVAVRTAIVAEVRSGLGRVMETPAWRVWCLRVVGVGLVARVVAVAALSGDLELFEFGVIGQNIADGRGYSFFAAVGDAVVPATEGTPLPSAFRGPVYAYLVAAATWIGESTSVDVAIVLNTVQLLLSVVTLGLVYLVARRLGPVPAALGATAMASVHPQLIALPALGSSANVDQPALLILTLAALDLDRRSLPRAVGVAAGAVGVLWLCRPEAPLFAVMAFGAAALGRRSTRVAGRGIAAMCIAAVLLSGVWLVPRSDAFDRPILTTTTSGGYNLWFGNAEGASGSQKRPPPIPTELVADIEAIEPGNDYELEFDQLYRDRALDDLADDPLRSLGLFAKKLVLALTFDPYDERAETFAFGFYTVALSVIAAIILFPLGGLRLLGSRSAVAWAIAATQVAISTVFFVLNRYKLTIDLQLIVISAAALGALASQRTPGSSRSSPRPPETGDGP